MKVIKLEFDLMLHAKTQLFLKIIYDGDSFAVRAVFLISFLLPDVLDKDDGGKSPDLYQLRPLSDITDDLEVDEGHIWGKLWECWKLNNVLYNGCKGEE